MQLIANQKDERSDSLFPCRLTTESRNDGLQGVWKQRGKDEATNTLGQSQSCYLTLTMCSNITMIPMTK